MGPSLIYSRQLCIAERPMPNPGSSQMRIESAYTHAGVLHLHKRMMAPLLDFPMQAGREVLIDL